MKTRFILMSILAVFVVACGQQAADSSQSAISGIDSANASKAMAQENAVNAEPKLPKPKSKVDQTKLQRQWEDAASAEKRLLGSPKLIGWMDALKSTTDEDGFDQPGKLTDAQYKGLSFQEKFCYYLFHPEMASQNCSMALFEIGLVQGISGSLPFGAEEYPSDRQIESMESQKAEIATWALKCISTNKAVSIQMMQAIVAYDVKAAIVPLLDLYASQPLKDDLLLTTCIELMRKAEYPAWTSSDVAAEMQVEIGGDYGGERGDFAALSDANVQKVIALARQFAGA